MMPRLRTADLQAQRPLLRNQTEAHVGSRTGRDFYTPSWKTAAAPPNNRRAVAEVPPGSLLKALEITSVFTGKIFFKN